MLSISELGKFYYLRNFHDMRCKYGRVLSVIHQQMNREPQAGEVYIMMSGLSDGTPLQLRPALVQPLRETL